LDIGIERRPRRHSNQNQRKRDNEEVIANGTQATLDGGPPHKMTTSNRGTSQNQNNTKG